MYLPADWVEKYFPRGANVSVGKYPNDKVQSICSYYQTKLDGAAATLYENGKLCTLANYHMAARDGWIRVWNENMERLYFAEYKRGKKHGLTCLFRDDLPWYVQQYEKGDLVGAYLVTQKSNPLEAIREQDLTPDGAKECALARNKSSELESQMDQGEVKLKKSVREWFLEADKDIKQARAAAQGTQGRQAIIERQNARGAARGAAFRDLHRAAWGEGR